jgi:glycine/sarcosine N-methyltransferase
MTPSPSLYKHIAAYYGEIFPLKEIRLAFVESLLPNPGRENLFILDIGCAAGELAMALSNAGHRVVGIDINEEMIKVAKKANEGNYRTAFLHLDMNEAPAKFNHSFYNAVLCLGNTLVHLDNPQEMENFFTGIREILKDQGVLILQIVNYRRILDLGITELPLIESEHCTFRREYAYDRKNHRIRFRGELRLKDSGDTFESVEILYPLMYEELEPALVRAGFSLIEFYGNEHMSSYNPSSPALIAYAEK